MRALDDNLGGRTDGPLFITSIGERMGQPEAWRMVRRVARRAGLASADELTTHSLRASFITGALDARVSLRDVQDAVGHADPRTTRPVTSGRPGRPSTPPRSRSGAPNSPRGSARRRSCSPG